MPIDEEIAKINLTWSIEMVKSIDQSEIEAIKQALSKSPQVCMSVFALYILFMSQSTTPVKTNLIW